MGEKYYGRYIKHFHNPDIHEFNMKHEVWLYDDKWHQPVLGKATPQGKSSVSILFGNLLLFTVVFSVLGLALKNILDLNSFGTAFWFFFALGEGLGVFDLVIIDLLWWRNTKRIRFSFLPEKSNYQNPGKHIGSFLRGIPLFAVASVKSKHCEVLVGCRPRGKKCGKEHRTQEEVKGIRFYYQSGILFIKLPSGRQL